MLYENVAGRTKEDLEKYGNVAAGYIGKHIVGEGEDAHLTTPLLLDFLRPHIMLITGKRGTGKSYSAGVITEEMLQLPAEYKNKLSFVIVDTMGIFWGLKYPNKEQAGLLKEWKLTPKKFADVNVYVPFNQKKEFVKNKIPVDGGISILPSEFSAEEWLLAFDLKRISPIGISLEKNLNQLIKTKKNFTIDDLIRKIKNDSNSDSDTKKALENMLTVANQWGLFGTQGIDIEKIVSPGQVSVIDVSRLRATEAWSVRNLLVGIIARKIYQKRVLERRMEEMAKMKKTKSKESSPVIWLVIDEAHNFVPSEFETASSEPILTIAKQGREPGVGLIVITQMPNKINQDILSQTDIVISHRLTSKSDLGALHSVMQSYVSEDLWKYLDALPRWPGAAIILDDNLEKIFTLEVRPRFSWHSGGTAGVI